MVVGGTKLDPMCCIDVLIGKADIPYDVWKNRLLRNFPTHLSSFRSFSTTRRSWIGPFGGITDQRIQDDDQAQEEIAEVLGRQDLNDVHSTLPDRMRINGQALKQLLFKIFDVPTQERPPLAPPHMPRRSVVMLKPFKLLVHHRSDINR